MFYNSNVAAMCSYINYYPASHTSAMGYPAQAQAGSPAEHTSTFTMTLQIPLFPVFLALATSSGRDLLTMFLPQYPNTWNGHILGCCLLWLCGEPA